MFKIILVFSIERPVEIVSIKYKITIGFIKILKFNYKRSFTTGLLLYSQGRVVGLNSLLYNLIVEVL